VVGAAGVTVWLPAGIATGEPARVALVVFVAFQLKIDEPPTSMLPGVARREHEGAAMATRALQADDPEALVTVNVYVSFEVGDTLVLPRVDETAKLYPAPLLILAVSGGKDMLVVVQFKPEESPRLMVVGKAVRVQVGLSTVAISIV